MAIMNGIADMEAEAARFVQSLSPHNDRATVVAMHGDLGAGKTTFVKSVARNLGVSEHVTSPTFVIEKIYPLENASFSRLVHIDAYRLKGEHQLKVLGWDDIVRDPSSLVFIEWPEQAGAAIPEDALHIWLRYSGENTRDITYGKNPHEKQA